MSAIIMDGKAVAAKVQAEVRSEATAWMEKTGRKPHLSVILVGEDPGSTVYVRNKERTSIELGMSGEVMRMPATSAQAEVAAVIDRLNADEKVHGILLQLPVPKGLDENALIQRISPEKDVDGLHPLNAGRLMLGLPGPEPCTPAGCVRLLLEYGIPTSGKKAVIVGRSNIVGKPMALLLSRKGKGGDCTVTIAHSRTPDLAAVIRGADIVVAAIGRSRMITGEMIKPGATVIDVGINRVDDPNHPKGGYLTGDVDFASAKEVAGHISPVPGGVGPMTIAMLMRNTLEQYKKALGLA
ncbi:MAG: bifunctional methylenetetrahydrofolate dehydrogenase/methenyltetrahydrofolate cyclohydrolase FolD [Candidatus Sumerlaeota bacterium]|nr:bifunctional methylenetetrahydrofolate dehydrogenase/methenyltetrahydrofolate cyclohydrolase FolD [Candidatus Sumerlaeota bacterium]